MNIHIIAEIKKDNTWKLLGFKRFKPTAIRTEAPCICWHSSAIDNIYGYIFSRETYPSEYSDLYPSLPSIYEGNNNKSPADLYLSKETTTYLNMHEIYVVGHITSDDINKFDWSFTIPHVYLYNIETAEKEFHNNQLTEDQYTSIIRRINGNHPEVSVRIDIPFREEFPALFTEVEALEMLGDDYRLLYYFADN